MTCSLIPTVACSLVAFSAFLVTASADPTTDFYEGVQERPILAYECYHTGVIVESEGTVNFTVLWDGSNPSTDGGYIITWAATSGSADSYDTSFLTFSYDNTTSALVINAQEHTMVLEEPFNGFAYYFRISVTSPENKVVYMIYDIDCDCGNAAALLRKIDQDGQQGFQFVRDVPEPSKTCTKHLLCAAQRMPLTRDSSLNPSDLSRFGQISSVPTGSQHRIIGKRLVYLWSQS